MHRCSFRRWAQAVGRGGASLLLVVLIAGSVEAQDRDPVPPVHVDPVVRVISPQAYYGGSQVWDIAQDGRGLLYLASANGLNQYDGARWRHLPTANETTPWALARTPAGSLYVGARDDLGLYRPDSMGRLTFRSLHGRVPAAHRPVGNVRDVVATTRAVLFRAETGVLRWSGAADSMQVVADSSATRLAQCRDTAYVHRSGNRLYRIEGATLAPLAGTSRLADAVVIDLIDDPGAPGCQVVTRTRGRFRLTPSGLTPLPWPGGPVDEPILAVARGPAGALAVATASTLRLVDPRGRVQRLSRGDRLPDGTLEALHVSDRQALWVATGAGIARIAWPDPVSVLREPPALRTLVASITRHEGRLTVGTANGVWQVGPRSADRIADTGQTFDLLSTDAGLLVTSDEGLALVQNGTTRFLATDNMYALLRSRRDSATVYASRMPNGLLHLRRRGSRWRVADRTDRLDAPIYTVAEDSTGAVWLGTGHRGLFRLDATETALDAAPIARFDTTDGLPAPSFNYSVQMGDAVRFITDRGLYRRADSTFVPDATFAPAYADDNRRHWPVVFAPNGAVWMDFGGHKAGVATGWPNAPVQWTDRPFRRLADFGDVDSVYPDAARDSIVWFGANNAVVRFDRRLERFGGHAQPFATLIREVRTRDDSLLYGGDAGAESLPAALDPQDASLRFTFGATSYEQLDGPTHHWDQSRQYRWRLDGVDAGWTDWTTEAQADYTSLPPGTHTFRVQARNLYRTVGSEAQMTLTILPPWYHTWWAYALYLLTAAGLVVGAVQWRTRRLRQHRRELEQTVAERTEEIERQKDRLEAQAERLQELDAAKSRFFANVSHEFRTPLTLIQGPVREARDRLRRRADDGTLADVDDQLDLAERNTARLERLVDQLLRLARLDADTYELDARPTKPADEVIRIARPFEPLAERHGLSLSVDAEEAPSGDSQPVYADPEALERVLSNLLSNAITFTPEDGRVEVTVTEHAEGVSIAVGDTGPGIPEAQRAVIFERFRQVDDTSTRTQGGVGIGLALTQNLVNLHGGTLDLESTVGEGSTFTVHLPRGREHLSDDQIAPGAGAPEFDDLEASSNDEPDLRAPGPPLLETSPSSDAAAPSDPDDAPNAQSKAQNPKSKIVLVVDDNADVRTYVRSVLTPDFRVRTAPDGERGLAAAREDPPDCILADVMMPGMDGVEVVQALRRDPATDCIPVIMLTARATVQDELEGLGAGADDYVTKPFDPDVLKARVRGQIDLRYRLRRRIRAELRTRRGDGQTAGDGPADPLGDAAAGKPPQLVVSTPFEGETAFVASVREAIEDQLADPDLTVEMLASDVAVSRSTLYRRLKEEAGCTPTVFIQRVRLQHAARLLRRDEGTISEVAYAVGFNSHTYFTRSFREHFDRTPSAYVEQVA